MSRFVARQVAQRDTAPAQAGPAAASGIIVSDSVVDVRPEQMRRGEFVAQARSAALDGARSGAGPLSSSADEQVNEVFARYAALPAAEMEQKLRAEVAGATGAASASGLLGAVRQAATNEARGRLGGGVTDSAAEAVGALHEGVAGAMSAVSELRFKPRDGVTPSAGPGQVAEVRSRLGQGGDVPTGVRAEVEQVSGQNLSDVRLHQGGAAGSMADELGARAFTVGHDVVIGSGETSFGTPEGDALLAHELAHAAQQARTGDVEAAEKSVDSAEDSAEIAADDVAVDAVMGLWAGVRERFGGAAAQVKSGLRLQRCGGKAKIDPTKEELNKKVLQGMATADGKKSASAGVHYPFNYKRDYPDDWKRLGSPGDGYADPKFWTRVEYMHWLRKPGVSASAAMDAWFAGPTIAECASVATAAQVNALRAALGDDKFDRLFGGTGTKPIEGPDGKRINLEIGQGAGSSVVAELMKATDSAKDAGTPGHRNVKPGEWHYFANHPDYVKKHPAGFWQGENAVFHGEVNGVQMWTGFGVPPCTEAQMNAELVKAYKEDPSPEDVAKRKRLYEKHGPDAANWPQEMRRFHGEFAPSITVDQLIAAGGGFQGKDGKELDPAKVAALKNRADLN